MGGLGAAATVGYKKRKSRKKKQGVLAALAEERRLKPSKFYTGLEPKVAEENLPGLRGRRLKRDLTGPIGGIRTPLSVR